MLERQNVIAIPNFFVVGWINGVIKADGMKRMPERGTPNLGNHSVAGIEITFFKYAMFLCFRCSSFRCSCFCFLSLITSISHTNKR